MAQYNTGKNPPWARDPSQMAQQGVVSMAQPQMGMANPVLSQPGVATPTVYSLGNTQPTMNPHQYSQHPQQQLTVQGMQYGNGMGTETTSTMQQSPHQYTSAYQHNTVPPAGMQQAVQLPQPGIAIPTTLATTQVAPVSYPAPRPPTGPPTQQGPKQQRVFTGQVTKLHDNFGFVDDDVFFQTSCVKGPIPKVGDRVLVEASYNANMPFKWNATRIQQQAPSMGGPGIGPSGFGGQAPVSYNLKPSMGPGITPSAMPISNSMNQPPPLMGQQAQPAGVGLLGGPPPGRPGIIQPPRRIENQDFRPPRSDRGRDRDRDHRERRERRSPRKRSRSPRRSKSPSTRRSPQRRRQTRIVPRYMVQIPKLSLDNTEANVIALKGRYNNLYIPSDFFHAGFAWTRAFPLYRNIHMGNSCTFNVMSKDVEPLNKPETSLEPTDADHLYSAKVMLLSCPTREEFHKKSCALTEELSEQRDSFQHPTRLVQFLVGMKGKSEPMAIGGPWSPTMDGPNPTEDPRVLINTAIRTTRALTGIDLSSCTQWYRFVEIRYHRPEEMHKGRLVPARVETVVIFLPDVWSCSPTRLEWNQMQTAYLKQLQDKIADENKEESQEDEEEGDSANQKKDPSHHADLDPKNMKVADLRKELEARNLSSKGLKSQLIARLTKAIKTEQEKEEEEAENKEVEEEPTKEEEEQMEIDKEEEEKRKKEEEEERKKKEKERVAREKRYQIPENPTIVVHPSATAKSGKFDCTVMSLSVLLDYRPEDNKEHCFEVSLFAEMFNEMLMRDFGFKIYKALLAAPEPKKEDDKKDNKDKKEDKKSDKKEDKKDEKKDDKKEEKKEKKEDKKEEKKDEKEKDKEPEKEQKVEEEDDKETEEPAKKKRKASEHEEEKEKTMKEEEKEEEKTEKNNDKEKEEEEKEEEGEEGTEENEKEKEKDNHRSSKEKEKEKEKKREKIKFYTADRDLLLAFVYFDQSHTGYLIDKDVEDILHTLGLQLSRAQIKKLVQKLVSRDTLNYRKLTDKPIRPDNEKDETDTEKETDAQVLAKEALASGNKPFLTSVREDLSEVFQAHANTLRSPGKAGKGSKDSDGDSSSGMVMYKGAMLDIKSVMTQLERSEKARTAVEIKLKDNEEEMDILKTSFSSSEQNSQKVCLELQELKKKLRDQRKATESAEVSSKKYLDSLLRSRGTLSGVMDDLNETTGSSDDKQDVKMEVKKEVVNGE